GGFELPAPPLQAGQRVDWPDLLRFVEALMSLVRNRRDRMERRLRKCLALASLARSAHFEKITGPGLKECLDILTASPDAQVAPARRTMAEPSWIGRILFRQALALFARKDQGPNRGAPVGNRLALLRAACRFALGRGAVPRLHGWLPETTFERVE